MTKSLVLELQEMASDKQYDVDDLLRKALLVAAKLSLTDFREWINHELKGYPDGVQVPEYRTTRASMHVLNPVQGRQQPFYLHNLGEDLVDTILTVHIQQPIASLVELTKGDPDKDCVVQLSAAEERFLLEGQGEFPLQPIKKVSRNSLITAIDGVRSTILEWALNLESEGILGDGMTFSNDEKQKAAASTEIHIANFQGVLGNVTHSHLNQRLQMTINAGDFENLRSFLDSSGVLGEDINELQKAIEADSAPSSSGKLGPRVSAWIGKMVTKASSGHWAVSAGAAGDLLSRAIGAYYGLS